MNKIKNILSLGLLSIMALLIGFSSINYVLADDVKNLNMRIVNQIHIPLLPMIILK